MARRKKNSSKEIKQAIKLYMAEKSTSFGAAQKKKRSTVSSVTQIDGDQNLPTIGSICRSPRVEPPWCSWHARRIRLSSHWGEYNHGGFPFYDAACRPPFIRLLIDRLPASIRSGISRTYDGRRIAVVPKKLMRGTYSVCSTIQAIDPIRSTPLRSARSSEGVVVGLP